MSAAGKGTSSAENAQTARSELIGVALALLSILASSLLPVMGRFSTSSYPPLLFVASSAGIGAICLLACLSVLGRPALTSLRKPFVPAVLTGFLSTGMTSLLLFLGMLTTRAVDAALLLQAEIPYALLISYFMLNERIRGKQVAYTALVFAGVLAVLYRGGSPALGGGALLVLIAPLFWPLGVTYAKRMLAIYDPVTAVFSRLAYGAAFLFLASIAIEGTGHYGLLMDARFVAAAAFQGIFVFALGHIAWYLALGRINLSKATGLIGIAPSLSFVFSWLFLGESIELFQFAGLALVLAGTYLMSTRIRSELRPGIEPA